MTPRFRECLAVTLKYEGTTFTDHPNDAGGPTRYGVTQRTYDAWRRKGNLKLRSVREIGIDEVEAVYYRDFWGFHRADLMPPPVDLVHFDNSVILGRPRELLQFVLRVHDAYDGPIDGALGPKSMAGVARMNPKELALALLDARGGYHTQSLSREANRAFIEGWANRVDEIQDLIYCWR